MEISKNQIDEIFADAEDQAEAFFGLYRLIYPNWDEIKQVIGYPKTSLELDCYIFDKFIELDREKHPGVLPGGLWMNRGFSTDDKLKGNVVIPAKVKIR